MRKMLNRAFSIIISSVIALTWCTVLPVNAAVGGTMIEITKESQVVDTMTYNGKTVSALYHPIDKLTSEEVFSDEIYSCAALIKKFYKTVFSIDMDWLMPGNDPTALNAEFVKTPVPKAGDIYMCNNHWAIVKKVSGSTVTLFEQNWCWLGGEKGTTTYAQYGRTVDTKSLDKSIGETFYTVSKASNSDLLKPISAVKMSIVANFKVASITAASVCLTWNKVIGAEGYIVYKYDELKKTWVRLIKTSSASTTYTVSDLSNATSYRFAVKAYKTVGGKEVTSTSFPTVSAITALPTVSGFKTAAVSGEAVRLTWNKVGSADGYILYKYDNAKKTWVRVAKTETASNTYTISKLSNATSYRFAVKAYKTVGGKEVTSTSFPTVSTSTVLPTVTGFKTSAVSGESVRLTWNKVGSADGYILYKYDIAKKTWVRVAKTETISNTYTVSELSNATPYRFAVKAYKTVGGREVTSASFPTVSTTTVLSNVVNKTAIVGKNSVKLAWNKVGNADGYIVYSYDNAKKTWIRTVKTTSLNYTYKNLSSNTSYKFTVKAYKTVSGKEITSLSFTPVSVKTKK